MAASKKCRVCGNVLRAPKNTHCHERSPVWPDWCLGCWMGFVQIELWYFRATGRTEMGLTAETVMRDFLKQMRTRTIL